MMTKEQIITAAEVYKARLIAIGADPMRMADRSRKWDETVPLWTKHNHLAWMCERIPKEVNEGNVEKARHWLGCVQGALLVMGEYSIDELRTHDGVKEVP